MSQKSLFRPSKNSARHYEPSQKHLNVTPPQPAPTYHSWRREVCTASPGPSHTEFRAAQLKGILTHTHSCFLTASLNHSCKQPITSLLSHYFLSTHTHIHPCSHNSSLHHTSCFCTLRQSLSTCRPEQALTVPQTAFIPHQEHVRFTIQSLPLCSLPFSVKMRRNTWQAPPFLCASRNSVPPPLPLGKK